MISPGNSHTSRGFFLRFRFCLGHVLCNSELSLSRLWPRRGFSDAPRHQARGLQFVTRWRALRISLASLRSFFCLVSPLPCVSLLPWKVCRPILFLLSEGSSGLQVPVVLRADNPCFHSWGWLIIQPPVLSSLTDFSPWDPKEVVILIKGNLGLFVIMNPLL
jgi:hypothetical protein